MGMGYGANHADVIEVETLKKLLPKQYAALEKALELDGDYKTLEDYAALQPEDREKPDGIHKAMRVLQLAFSAKFKGLELELLFHNQDDEGDRYDDVNGAFWHIYGLYVLSPGAKKLGAKNFTRKFYVTFG
jgi:hypothetical protein